jgi:hypothetical protein
MFIEAAVDNSLIFDDGADSPYTASGRSQVGSSNAVIDFGVNWKDNPSVSVSLDIDQDTLELGGSETYSFEVQQADDSGLSTITARTSRDIDPTSEDFNGGRLVFALTLKNRFLGVNYTMAGTGPSLPVNLGFIGFLKQS